MDPHTPYPFQYNPDRNCLKYPEYRLTAGPDPPQSKFSAAAFDPEYSDWDQSLPAYSS